MIFELLAASPPPALNPGQAEYSSSGWVSGNSALLAALAGALLGFALSIAWDLIRRKLDRPRPTWVLSSSVSFYSPTQEGAFQAPKHKEYNEDVDKIYIGFLLTNTGDASAHAVKITWPGQENSEFHALIERGFTFTGQFHLDRDQYEKGKLRIEYLEAGARKLNEKKRYFLFTEMRNEGRLLGTAE